MTLIDYVVQFLLINKIQNLFGINLRKDGKEFTDKNAADILSHAKSDLIKKKREKISGNEIELLPEDEQENEAQEEN